MYNTSVGHMTLACHLPLGYGSFGARACITPCFASTAAVHYSPIPEALFFFFGWAGKKRVWSPLSVLAQKLPRFWDIVYQCKPT